ncbi:hypothetical protein MSH26_01115 [bacterium]|nr:hypothetical protein [bacterium]MDY3757227.1 hypothetical protein [Bacilli bacterium]
MIIDFITYNYTNILLFTVLLNIFNLNNKRLYFILLIDILINGIPFITIILILLYFFNLKVFNYLNNNFLNKYLLLIVYYFIFGIIIYSIFNKFNLYIIKLLIINLFYNLLYFYIGLKYLENKYS